MTKTTDPKMLEAFDRFIEQINTAYGFARAHIAAGNYVEAQNVLARIATVHSKTAMSLRSLCIKRGWMPTED